jgi:GPH family glycoside/pentoside/hexuronide:cation symporter
MAMCVRRPVEFLKHRDGTPDIYGDCLSKREVFFEKIEQKPVRSKGGAITAQLNQFAGPRVKIPHHLSGENMEPSKPFTVRDADVASRAGSTRTRVDRATTPTALPLAAIIAYAAPSLVLGFSSSLVVIYILKFATDVMLIAPGLFAAVFSLARVWDAVSDPVVGYLSDRTTSSHGRRRPWIALGALPLAGSVVLLWSPPASLIGTASLVWIAVAIVLFYTAYTIVAVPHLALGAEMTSDYHERSKVFGGRGIFDFSGVLLAALAIWFLQTTNDPRDAARWVAWGFAVLSIPLLWLSVGRMVERPEYLGRGGHNPIAAFKDVWRNHYARILITVFFLENVGLAFISTLTPFIVQYIMPGFFDSSGPFVALALAVSLVSFPLWFPLSRRFGKRNTWLVSNTFKIVGFGSVFFVGPGTEWISILSLVMIGASLSAHIFLAPSVKADVVDFDEYSTGERKEGAYFAIWNLAQKIGGATAVFLGGVLLELSDYQANIEQTPETIWMIRSLFAGVPLVLYLLVMVLLLNFSFNQREHAAIRTKIDQRSDPSDPDPAV